MAMGDCGVAGGRVQAVLARTPSQAVERIVEVNSILRAHRDTFAARAS